MNKKTMIRRRTAKEKKQGFTLIEVIIVILILGVIVSVGGVLLGLGFRGGFASKDLVYAASMARVAIGRMGDDILNARSATAANLSLNSNSITFASNDGISISYSLSGTNLMRNSKILSKDIGALNFTYYDQIFSTTSIPSDVRCIQINMTVTYNNSTNNLTTLVCPRNFSL